MCDKIRCLRTLLLAVGIFVLCMAGCAEEGARVKKCSGAKGKELVVGKEGFWRLKQDGNGVWWFLSPEGKEEFLNTVTTVQPYQKGEDEKGLHYVSKDWKGSLDAEIWVMKPEVGKSELDYWAAKTIERVKEAGFKGLGGWCNWAFYGQDVSITRVLGLWNWSDKKRGLFYSPEWGEKARETIKKQVIALRDNRNLVGYFLDNELGWGDEFSSAERYFNGLENDNPNRREVVKVIRSLWKGIEDFNKEWGAELKDWDELASLEKLPRRPAKVNVRLEEAWLYHLARDYFEFATGQIRKYDRNHLIMGVRFRGNAPREVCRAARGLTDVVSINNYPSEAKISREMFEMMYEETGQPIVITEYGFHSLDGRSGNRNRCGFIWGHVLDQKAKADGYRIFTKRFARVPYIIGADWFQWNDEPPSGRGDGEDVNFGIVDIYDEAYENMVEAVRETTPMLNDLHSKSFSDTQQDIWAKIGDKPAALNIPYLETAILLDGDLSDWPTESKAGDIKYLEAVGIERAGELVVPKVCLGWKEDGLYAGVEVFDKNIDGYALNEETLKHIWRGRSFDCVELWFSMRPTTDEQNWYDRYCCDFMFIPDGNGTIMQWHHRGDTLDGDRIPHPDIKHFFKKSTDGYTVEMFIPAGVLNGFEPKANSEMSGNIFVRNWQPRIDWYWSCGEFGQPGKWGRMKLIK